MPPVPAVRGSQVLGALEKAEFVVGRINGSHHIMRATRMAGGPPFPSTRVVTSAPGH